MQTIHDLQLDATKPSLSAEEVQHLVDEREGFLVRLDEYENAIAAFWDEHEDTDQAGEFINAYERCREEVDPADRDEIMLSIDAAVKSGMSLLSGILLDYQNIRQQLERNESELDEGAGKELNAYAREQAGLLLSRVDEDLIAKFGKEKVPPPDSYEGRVDASSISKLTSTLDQLKEINGSESDQYHIAEYYLDCIESAEEIFTEWGVIDRDTLAVEKAKYNLDELERAYDLNKTYRNYHRELSPIEAVTKNLLPIHEWGVNLDEHAVASQVEHLRNLDKEGLIEGIDIDITKAGVRGLTVEQIKDTMRRFPAITFEGVRRVSFRSGEGDVYFDTPDDDEFSTTAYHLHDRAQNSAEIVVFTHLWDDIRAEHATDYTDDFINRMHINEMMESLSHELGHALHTKLPVSFLGAWDNIALAENVDVSEYVALSRIEGILRHKREDFADSVKLYIVSPEDLRVQAPKRHLMIKTIFQALDPTDLL